MTPVLEMLFVVCTQNMAAWNLRSACGLYYDSICLW
jgi:hypothetical protein